MNQTLAEKRAQAIEYLGVKWVAHREYKPTPRHSVSRITWWPHRVLRDIQDKATAAGRI